MRRRIEGRATYANVVATVALFVALGGSALALSRNSVKSKHIKNDQVRSADLKNEQVKSVDLKDGTILSADIRDGEVKPADTSTSLRLTCPGGTVFIEGACLETSDRTPVNWPGAESDCSENGGRLPSPAELLSYGQEPGVQLGATERWTANFANGTGMAQTVYETVSKPESTVEAISSMLPYRCVMPPLR